MIQEKTQKKVLKVIEGLKAGKNLNQALKAAKILRGHYYSARDGMVRDGNAVVSQFVSVMESVKQPKPKLASLPKIENNDLARLHAQALRENDRLKWAEELIAEIKGTQQRQSEILKKLMA